MEKLTLKILNQLKEENRKMIICLNNPRLGFIRFSLDKNNIKKLL